MDKQIKDDKNKKNSFEVLTIHFKIRFFKVV